MFTFIIRRLMMLPIVLIGVTLFVILLTQLLSPTQRAASYVKSEAQLKNIEKVIEQYGIDKPWYVQYGNWLKEAVQGNFGFSKSTGEPVLTAFWRRFPNTLELAILVIIPTLLLGIGFGVLAALNRDSLIDQIIRASATMLWSLPTFVLAIWLLAVFYGGLGWFGFGQVSTAHKLEIIKGGFNQYTRFMLLDALLNARFDIFWDAAGRLVLPVVTMVAVVSAMIIRVMRSTLLDVLNQDFVRTARAKGLESSKVNYKHALRNALIPIVTLGGGLLMGLVEGATIVEYIFARPGVGSLMVTASLQLDIATLLASATFLAIVTVLSFVLIDVLYAVVDPRIRYS